MTKPPMDMQGWEFLCRGIRLSKVSILNFSGTKMSNVAFKLLCSAMESLRGLVSLDLSDTGIDDECMQYLARTLRIRTRIEHLMLPFNTIGPVGMFHLCKVLPIMTHLRTLDLSCNPLTDDGLRCLKRSMEIMEIYGELEDGVKRQSPIERYVLSLSLFLLCVCWGVEGICCAF